MSPQTTAKPTAASGDGSERILAAAEALFSKHGFDAVSINAIAAHAGVSKANVFHHFNSKDELYIAVLREACRDAAENLHHLQHDDRPFPERLAEFAREHLSHIMQRHEVTRLIQREMLNNQPGRAQDIAEKVFGDIFQRLVQILREGQACGELRADVDPAMLAILLIGADVFFFQARGLLQHFPDVTFAKDPDRYSRMMIDMLLHGILPRTPAGKKNPRRPPAPPIAR
jgi:TetR/AcrR family transcriptional regulator